MLAGLLGEAHQMHPDDLGSSLGRWAETAGLTEVVAYVVDRDQRRLTPLGRSDVPVELVDGSLAGRCYQRSEQVIFDADDARHAWFPLLDGTARMGVMHARLGGADPGVDVGRGAALASLAAYLIVAKTSVGDGIARLFNARALSLAAEMRWATLPPLAFENARLAIGAMLQPAYEIAGDTFDYAIVGDDLQLGFFDAMGHGLRASQLANIAVYAYRLARRERLALEDVYRSIDDSIAAQFGDQLGDTAFVTAQLVSLDLSTGTLRSICAGHPKPLLLRDRTSVHELEAVAHLPLGIGYRQVAVTEQNLQPGDTVVYYSDGISEARSRDGEEFGIDRLKDFLVRAASADLTASETARRALHSVADHHQDRLADDATLVLVKWHGAG